MTPILVCEILLKHTVTWNIPVMVKSFERAYTVYPGTILAALLHGLQI